MIDYKALLEKYIAYVAECEGTDFVTDREYDDPHSGDSIARRFTADEWAALRAAPDAGGEVMRERKTDAGEVEEMELDIEFPIGELPPDPVPMLCMRVRTIDLLDMPSTAIH